MWFVGYGVRERRTYQAGLAEQAQQQRRAEAERARHALQQERLLIARELHDVLAHTLSVVTVQAGVGRRVGATRPAEALRALAGVEDASRGALDELRRVLCLLRSDDEPAPAARTAGIGGRPPSLPAGLRRPGPRARPGRPGQPGGDGARGGDAGRGGRYRGRDGGAAGRRADRVQDRAGGADQRGQARARRARRRCAVADQRGRGADPGDRHRPATRTGRASRVRGVFCGVRRASAARQRGGRGGRDGAPRDRGDAGAGRGVRRHARRGAAARRRLPGRRVPPGPGSGRRPAVTALSTATGRVA